MNRRAASAVILLMGLSLVGAGGYWIWIRQTGPHAMAKVDECEEEGRAQHHSVRCTGSWTVGDLLNGGSVGVGLIHGAEMSDQGKTIEVVIHGDEAFTLGLGLPLVLLAMGLGCSAVGVRAMVIGR